MRTTSPSDSELQMKNKRIAGMGRRRGAEKATYSGMCCVLRVGWTRNAARNRAHGEDESYKEPQAPEAHHGNKVVVER